MLFFCSCASARIDASSGLREYVFNKVKVSIEGPSNMKGSESTYDGPEVFFQLYPIQRPMKVISDTIYRIKITVKRTTLASFKQSKEKYLGSGLYKRSNEKERQTWLWILETHEQFACRNEGQYSYCRKDVILDNGELLSGEVEILNAGWKGQGERVKALKIVEGIMNSIKPLQ